MYTGKGLKMIQTIKHASGKRLWTGKDTQAKTVSKKIQALARIESASIGETSAREILKGETRKGWKVETMQRRREPMRIWYSLTNEGRGYLMTQGRPDSCFVRWLECCEAGEASDVAEKMLPGFPQYNRQRVLIDGAKAVKMGLVTIRKQSGKIGA